MIIKASFIATLASLAVVTTEVAAADASILGSGLTANGADPSASADGMIPAYTGGISKPPADYVAGGDHVDPFAADNRSSASQLRIWGNIQTASALDKKPCWPAKKAIIEWISIRRAAPALCRNLFMMRQKRMLNARA